MPRKICWCRNEQRKEFGRFVNEQCGLLLLLLLLPLFSINSSFTAVQVIQQENENKKRESLLLTVLKSVGFGGASSEIKRPSRAKPTLDCRADRIN